MRRRSGVLLLIVALCFASVCSVIAIPTFYGSSYDTPGKWIRLLNTNASIYVSGVDYFHHPWQAGDLPQIANSGLKVIFRIFWWQEFYNGEIAWNTSVVDLYYNPSLLSLLEEHINLQFSYLDTEKIWAVTLSEGEPEYSFRYFNTLEGWRKYNDTYHSETGFWLRGGNLPAGESLVLNKWMSEKWSWVFNHLYDYIKIQWPHILVFQSAEQWPGAPPVRIGGIDISGLKADAYIGELYYNEAYDNPFWLYEFVRQHKTSIPDIDYHIWLWGLEAWPKKGLAGGFEHIRRNAWVAYLAGADAIGWFNWHNIYGNILDREDPLGKRLYEYTNRLNQEMAKLPTFKPKPQILMIRDQMMSFQAGLCCDLGIFNEWDVANQATLVYKETDLSQYKLILLSEDVYHDEFVNRLNDYVKSGGNLILLGGFASTQNAYGNATRTKLLIEEGGVSQEFIQSDINVNISEPNPLGLNLQYIQSNAMIGITKATMTDDHHPIGEFNYVDEDGELSNTNECPLVLYHNSSNPDEGSILYWGVLGPTSTHDGKQKEVVEAFLPEWNYTRHLYITVFQAFTGNYLHLIGSLATSGTENLIVTQSEIEDGVILAGISNFNPQNVDVNFYLDLDQFDLSAGKYWVHSLDENSTLGWFESQMNFLEVPLEVLAQGTRLLLISQKLTTPSYSIKIFPDVPTPEDVEDLWLPRLKIISDHGSVKGDGKYVQGSTASFEVSPTNVLDDLGTRHVFVGWNSSDPGGYTGPNNPAKVAMANDIAEVASWNTQYFLTVEAGTGGSVTTASGWYDAGSEVTIQALPRSGFLFSSWIGSGLNSYSGSNSTVTVRLNEPITEKAIFLDVADPTAKAGSDRAAQVGENVVFDARGSTDNVGIVSYEWDLGDGAKEVGPIAIHTYNEVGSRTVTLVVKDAVGNSDADTITITVEAKEPAGEKWTFPTWILILLGAGILIGIIPYLLTRVTSP